MDQRAPISVFHPTARVKRSAAFPQGWRESMLDWFKKCDHPEDVEYVLSVHHSRWTKFENSELGTEFPPFGKVVIVRNTHERDDNVTNANAAAAATSGEILVGNMDDLFPPEHWDTLIRRAIPSTAGQYVIHCSTGSPSDKTLINAGAMTRRRYERMGYILHPSYESMYADNEFSEVARRDGVVISRLDIQFVHRHPAFSRAQLMDDVYRSQNAGEKYQRGLENYERRKALGFPRVSEPQPVTSTQKNIAVCLPGETFSSVWLAHWTALLPHLMALGNVQTYFGFSSVVYATRQALMDRIMAAIPPPDYVLWIDDDNLLTTAQFDRLLEDLETNKEIDSVSGWSWAAFDVYETDAKLSVGSFDKSGKAVPMAYDDLMSGPDDLKQIEYTGFPAVLMRFDVLVRSGGRPFVPAELLSFPGEDETFCKRASERGGVRFFVDRRVQVPHLKLRAAEPIGWKPKARKPEERAEEVGV
jgi:hypothetical protein